MANIKLHRIEFLQNNLFGEFVAGDILEVFLETDDIVVPALTEYTGVTVEKNGSPLSSTLTLIYISPERTLVQNFDNQICSGPYLIVPGISTLWPYGQYYSLADHYSCQANPPTCDLIFIGTPLVTPASDSETADGVITVIASSSNAIQYSLNNFVYGDGQPSNVFSGLLSGDYRIYLRDSANCGVNVLVTVPFTNTYGTFYRYEYDDIHGNTTIVDINKRGYSGSINLIKGGSNAIEISLRGEGQIDKFSPILSSQANINLLSETDNYFLDLYTNDRNLFQVVYYKGSNFKWIGKLLPFTYQSDYKASPYDLNISATDGLAELSNFYLIQKDGQKFYGTSSLIKLIAYCLNKIKLELPIKVAINLYADNMYQTDSDDPLDQAYCDYELFYLASEQPSLDFVIRNILKTFKARLIQWDGYWNIVRVEELGASYDYREFDKNGNYVDFGSFNPIIDLEFPDQDAIMSKAFPSFEMQPGYGQVKVFYNLGLKHNIINNGDFRLKSTYIPSLNIYSFDINKDGFTLVNAGYPITEGYEKIDDGNVAYYMSSGEDTLSNPSGGEAYLQTDTYSVSMGVNNQLKINLRYKVTRSSVTFAGNTYQIEVPYVKFRIRVKYGNLYLQGDGSWTNTDNKIEFFVNTFNEYLESEITASQPLTETPTSGMDFDIRIYHAYAFWAQFQSLTALRAFDTYTSSTNLLPTGHKTEVRDDFTLPSNMYYYQLEETTDAESGYDIVRPDDYHALINPRQWVRKYTSPVGTASGANTFTLFIDRIIATYLTGGKESIDTIIRVANAEPLNNNILEEEVIMGSDSSIIVTETNFSIDLGVWFPNVTPGLTLTTTNILSSRLIYAGWLRDVSGNGYEFWARDGVDESDKLHAILLRTVAAQYSSSWRLLRAELTSRNELFGLLNSLREVNDGNRIYIPISLSIRDRDCSFAGEFLELSGAGLGTGTPFSSAFSIGFGASGFN